MDETVSGCAGRLVGSLRAFWPELQLIQEQMMIGKF